jgi:integral membrane protein (TIGR01906 family)
VAQWLFIFCLPVLLVTASLAWAVNSPWLYEYGFKKYDVSSTTGLTETELEKVAVGLVYYFESNEEYIDLTVMRDGKPFELFNAREIAHLKDVKGLFWLDYYVLFGTLIYALVYVITSLVWRRREYWRRLAWAVVGGSSLTLVPMLVLGIGALINRNFFDQLYLQFHFFAFANDLWQLDPGRDYLIMLITGGFQYDVFLFCALVTASGAVILGGLAIGLLLSTKRRAEPI